MYWASLAPYMNWSSSNGSAILVDARTEPQTLIELNLTGSAALEALLGEETWSEAVSRYAAAAGYIKPSTAEAALSRFQDRLVQQGWLVVGSR